MERKEERKPTPRRPEQSCELERGKKDFRVPEGQSSKIKEDKDLLGASGIEMGVAVSKRMKEMQISHDIAHHLQPHQLTLTAPWEGSFHPHWSHELLVVNPCP